MQVEGGRSSCDSHSRACATDNASRPRLQETNERTACVLVSAASEEAATYAAETKREWPTCEKTRLRHSRGGPQIIPSPGTGMGALGGGDNLLRPSRERDHGADPPTANCCGHERSANDIPAAVELHDPNRAGRAVRSESHAQLLSWDCRWHLQVSFLSLASSRPPPPPHPSVGHPTASPARRCGKGGPTTARFAHPPRWGSPRGRRRTPRRNVRTGTPAP